MDRLISILSDLLPGSTVLSVDGDRVCLHSKASGKDLLAAEIALRTQLDGQWELLCVSMSDKNALRMVTP